MIETGSISTGFKLIVDIAIVDDFFNIIEEQEIMGNLMMSDVWGRMVCL